MPIGAGGHVNGMIDGCWLLGKAAVLNRLVHRRCQGRPEVKRFS